MLELGLVPGSFLFYAGTAPDKAEQVRAELVSEVEKLASDGLTEVELERAKKTMIGKQTIDMQSNGALLQVASLNELYGLGFDHHEKNLKEIEEMGLGRIRDVARKYFHERARVIVEGAESPHSLLAASEARYGEKADPGSRATDAVGLARVLAEPARLYHRAETPVAQP